MRKFFKSIWQQNNTSDPRDKHHSYLYSTGKPIWMERNYEQFAREAYIQNVIVFRSITMIAQAAASIKIDVYEKKRGVKQLSENHDFAHLLKKPNPLQSGRELLEEIYTYRQIHGNAYLLASYSDKAAPCELYSIRPDRIKVLSGANFLPSGYRYEVNNQHRDYFVDQLYGKSQILHIKNFHPLSDWYGLSSIEAAAYSIDQHNQAGAWNQSLLQNGARPSGAVIVKDADGKPTTLSAEQFARLKGMIDDNFSGSNNSGKPMILEGGLEWREMSLSPKDMDFIECKHSAARDISLAFGVPPQLLGIPGDNTYSNLKEARIALWEQTVLPLVDNTVKNIEKWLNLFLDAEIELRYDIDNVSIFASKRDIMWERVKDANFMTNDEKRSAVGI